MPGHRSSGRQGANSRRHDASSRRHDASIIPGDVYIDHSSSWKKSPSSNSNLHWTCPNCSHGNLSFTYDTSCPFCYQPQPHGVVTYPFEVKSHLYRRTTPRSARLTGENQNDGIATPTNNAYPTLAATQPRPEPVSIAFQKKDSLLTAQQSNANNPLETTQYASNPPVDWKLHRYIVTQLYIIERLPLKNGAETMRNEYQLYIIQLMFQCCYKAFSQYSPSSITAPFQKMGYTGEPMGILYTQTTRITGNLKICRNINARDSSSYGNFAHNINLSKNLVFENYRPGFELDNALPKSMPGSRATNQRAFEELNINEAEMKTEDVVYHLHQDKYLNDVESDVAGFLLLVPEELRYNLQLEKLLEHPCWTCIPPDTTPSYLVPLTIANLPVVVPVRTYYPLHAGLTPPPDPHPRRISPVGQLANDTVENILDTFEEAVGFYLLINGMLQIIIPEDFDIASALNHYPRRFGSLKVSFISLSQIPTAGEATKRRNIPLTRWLNVGTGRNPSKPPTQKVLSRSIYGNLVSSDPTGPLPGPSLAIGSSVQAHVNRSNTQVRHHQAKLGLMTKRQDRVYLTLPTHLITQALTDSELDWDWPESGLQDVRLVAGENDVDLGRIAKTFDTDARTFPDGFEHDVSLVDVSSFPETVATGMRPGLALDWLSVQGWSNLQLNNKNVFLLDDRDRTAKSIGIRDHQTQMVGQGILINRQKSKPRGLRNALNFGRQNENVPSDIEACKRLVARSILYRVAQDYDAPDGQSGTPVCLLDEESEPGVQRGKVAGFTSYVQMVQDIQHYHIEGDQLANMLEHGRVAFYGAFKVPQEMREEHVII
ncbi:hypothetical protein PG990_014087 [Apiospora arundinis]